MAMRRSTQMLVLGIAIFVIGALVVVLSMGGGDDTANPPPTTSTTIQAGTVVIPAANVPAPVTFSIPEGKQAVAVQMPYVEGLAGYAKAGDKVNLYATIDKAPVGEVQPPLAKLVLPSVEVLALTGPGPGVGTGVATYLLALNTDEAEQVIFLRHNESLWMTLVPKDQPVATATAGRSYQNAF
jgi:Flp pilus assembly protein CpaB